MQLKIQRCSFFIHLFTLVYVHRALEIIRSPDHGGQMTIRGDDMTTVSK